MKNNKLYNSIIKGISKILTEALQPYSIQKLTKFFDNLETQFNITVEYDESKEKFKKLYIVTEDKFDDM